MGREIRKERDWSLFGPGTEKQVIYEDGKNVGEIRTERSFFGGESTNIYNTRGEKTGEIRKSFLSGGTKHVYSPKGDLGALNQRNGLTGNRDIEGGRDSFGNKVTRVHGGGLAKLVEESKEKKRTSSPSLETGASYETYAEYQDGGYLYEPSHNEREGEGKKKGSVIGKILKVAVGVAIAGGIAYVIAKASEDK